jgi:hypothetical protein
MPRQKAKNYSGVKLRIHNDIIAELKKAATRDKVSFNEEAVMRIGRTFQEEKLMGGQLGRNLVQSMTSSFFTTGQREALLCGKSDEISQWINDPQCYAAAALAVFQHLLMNQSEETLKFCRLRLGRIAPVLAPKESAP